jgi:hypothetical protein
MVIEPLPDNPAGGGLVVVVVVVVVMALVLFPQAAKLKMQIIPSVTIIAVLLFIFCLLK